MIENDYPYINRKSSWISRLSKNSVQLFGMFILGLLIMIGIVVHAYVENGRYTNYVLDQVYLIDQLNSCRDGLNECEEELYDEVDGECRE